MAIFEVFAVEGYDSRLTLGHKIIQKLCNLYFYVFSSQEKTFHPLRLACSPILQLQKCVY